MIVLTDYFVNFGTSKNREDTWTPTPTQLGYTENPISSGFHVESPVHVFLPSVLKILLRNDGWRALFKWTQSMSAPLNTRLCHTAKSPHRSTVFELTNSYVESSLQVYTSRESTSIICTISWLVSSMAISDFDCQLTNKRSPVHVFLPFKILLRKINCL